ncbi:MAG: DUF2510 domain-containing protein [Actinomycetota bacterium]
MTEPGWYTDPRDSTQYRYWDGTSWTEAVAPGSAAQTVSGDQAENQQAGHVEDPAAESHQADSAAVDHATTGWGEATDAFDDAVAATDGAIGGASDSVVGAADNAAASVDGGITGLGGQVADVAGQTASGASSALEGVVSGFVEGAPSVLDDGVSGAVEGASSVLDDGVSGVSDGLGSLGDRASATPLERAGAAAEDALLDFNPGGAAEEGPSFDGIDQGISVDDALGDVRTPISDAAETMVVDVPDMTDAPTLGDIGIPGDGRSFSSPIDTFGAADQTSVIPAGDMPPTDPVAPEDDRFAPPPAPKPVGFDPPVTPAPPGAEFDPSGGQAQSDPGFGPPIGGGPPGPPDHFGPPPGGPGPGLDPGPYPEPDRMAVPPPATSASRSRAPWIVLGVIGLAIVAVLAYLAIRSQDRTSVDAIAEGQCFADFDQFEATEIRSSVTVADCGEAHALEVFDVTDTPYLSFSEYPGEQVITDLAFRHCLDGFQGFVGITYEESALDVWALYPTEGSWNLNDDREVVCMVGAFDQSLTTGSLQGSGR